MKWKGGAGGREAMGCQVPRLNHPPDAPWVAVFIPMEAPMQVVGVLGPSLALAVQEGDQSSFHFRDEDSEGPRVLAGSRR
jgi:hypothetical protein